MTRNWGIPARSGVTYPPGCDWQKPPLCHCNTIAEAQSCYERCDDSIYEGRPAPMILGACRAAGTCVHVIPGCVCDDDPENYHGRPKFEGRPLYQTLLLWAFTVAVMVYLIWPVKAHALGAGKTAPAAWYCKPLMKFERSCTGVKAAAATLGKANALSLAKRCGASDSDLADARRCFEGSPSCAPAWQCHGTARGPNCCE